MRVQPAQRLPMYPAGWGGCGIPRMNRGMLGLGQCNVGDVVDETTGMPCPVPGGTTSTPSTPAAPSFAAGSCWDSSLNPVACGSGATYVVASDGSLTSYTGGATPAGGGLTTAQLTALTSTIAAGGQTAINISKALSTPSLVAGTGVVYNPATGQFYNPQTGQVVSPTTAGTLGTASILGTSLSSMGPVLILLVGGLFVLMMFAGGRR